MNPKHHPLSHRARRHWRLWVLVGSAFVATVAASSSLAGAAGPAARNGKLAYTAVVSALQLYAQAPEAETASRLVVSDSVDYEPVVSPDGTRIAFVSRRDGNDEIHVAGAKGSNVRRITSHPSYDWDPAWAPDSQRIVFASGRAGNSELYVIGADGQGLARLTNSADADENPAWSPDGMKITFWSEGDDDPEIYVMNADGTGTSPLTANSDADTFPTWSPDGSRIAFTSDRDRQGDAEIFVMNADGSGVLQLTATAGSVEDWSPAWSPEGERIAFVSDRGGDEDVFVMSSDGKGAYNVTDNEDVADLHPSWARDGRILFTSERAANLGIETADPDGSDRAVLARSPADETSPVWSPDGTRVAFVSDRGDGSRIFVAAASGRGLRRLTRDPRFDDTDPAWSPTGSRIVFVRTDEFDTKFLYTMNTDGTGLRFLLEAGGLCCPEWSPDGRQLALSLNGEIVVVDRNGKGRRLVSGNGSNTSPTWSPDGRMIAFDSDRDDDWDIYVVSARGGPAKQLTKNDVDDEWPDWSPDGRFIAFSRGDLDELEGSIYLMRADGSRQRRVRLQTPSAIPSWQAIP